MIDKSLETDFQRELIDAAHWDKIVQLIACYPNRVMDVVGTHLFVRDSRDSDFAHAACWGRNGILPAAQNPKQLPSFCRRCLTASSGQDLALEACSMANDSRDESCVARYCAPLVFRKEVIAILLVYLPAGNKPTNRQSDALARVLPEMSLAIASSRLQHSMNILIDEVEATRQHFAQDLHDSLAHTIGYLRLKLNHFSMEAAQLELTETKANITCMRDAADEAYELIRHTLAELEPTCSNDLAESILEQANVIGQRGGFEVRMTSSNQPIRVASEVQRQMLYICRETLNNIGRHAKAQFADIHLQWGIDCFTVRIKDDGIGFDPDAASFGDHFGLAIMKQRAHSVGGTFTIRSCPGQGTQILIWSPAAFTREGPH